MGMIPGIFVRPINVRSQKLMRSIAQWQLLQVRQHRKDLTKQIAALREKVRGD